MFKGCCGGRREEDEEAADESGMEDDPGREDPAGRKPRPAAPLRLDPDPACSDEEDERGGMTEPPATPVGKDELALKRHRFFSDLMAVAEAQSEHRVRFDPRGPSFSGESEEGLLGRQRSDLDQLVTRLESVTCRLESALAGLGELASPSPQPSLLAANFDSGERSLSPVSPPQSRIMSVSGYRELVAGPLATYLQLSDKIGGDVAAQAQLVKQAFNAQLVYVETASSRGEPIEQDVVKMLEPTSEKIQAVQSLREKNRASPYFNHLSAISESIPALAWVTVKPAPSPYVKEMSDAGQFYTNRVLKEWKEKDKLHVEWVKAWLETLTEMQRYVKQHHTTGLVWVGGCVPPPPPGAMPPPPPSLADLNLGDVSSADDRSALFAQINQGENITKGLKKVTSEMQTHKNPSLRSGPAPFKATVMTNSCSGPVTKPVTVKPPAFTRDGKKWLIEHQKGNNNLVVEGAEMNNVVYVYGCAESTVTIKGKINSVFLDSCRKTSVLFDTLVSSIEFVNCQSVQMQVLGKVPTVSVDKTNGCQIFLSKNSLDVEIISSTSTELNVCVPKANGEYTEYPIPEQLKTVIKTGGIETTLVENKG